MGDDARPTAAQLAVIEMPPFSAEGEPAAWRLPGDVLAGRLDGSREWFAATPVKIELVDGGVTAVGGEKDAKPRLD